jgi:hypothetical protein
MKSLLCCIGLVAVAVLTSPACGGDDSSPTGSGGSGGTAGSGGTGGSPGCVVASDAGSGSQTVQCTVVQEADKIPYTCATAPVYTCNASKSTRYPDGPNACRNDSDCAMINTPPAGIRDMVRTCAVGYIAELPPMGSTEPERVAACTKVAGLVSTCVRDVTTMKFMPPGISDACGKCYIDIALCSSAFCLGECIANADAIDCIKCQFLSGCRVPFEKCAGVDRME